MVSIVEKPSDAATMSTSVILAARDRSSAVAPTSGTNASGGG
jgi:hypothetical protein